MLLGFILLVIGIGIGKAGLQNIFAGDKSLRAAHLIAEQIHDKVEKTFPEIKHIMIHINPAGEIPLEAEYPIEDTV